MADVDEPAALGRHLDRLLAAVGNLKFQISVSLDGFVAGPNQSAEHPLGEGGEALHDWVFELEAWRRAHGREGGEVNASTEVFEEASGNVGAILMGRNMFGGGPGPWGEEPWTGWWGEEPPFHVPVFVLTHHEREPLEMEGGTTFHFVTDGIEAALEQATPRPRGDRTSRSPAAAQAIQQYLAAGLVDEMWLHVVPILLGAGRSPVRRDDRRVAASSRCAWSKAPGVAHLKYRRAG